MEGNLSSAPPETAGPGPARLWYRGFLLGLGMLWASPTTLLGLLAGLLTLLTGGRAALVGRTLEFHGGFAHWLLARGWIRASAMTIGHVILGRDPECLAHSRAHELVHVRQCERWGPLFLPAYFGCMLILWLRGKNGYFDNPFEREAYGLTSETPQHSHDRGRKGF